MSPFAPEYMARIQPDGVWRPEPWLAGWKAVKYEKDGKTIHRTMDDAPCGNEEAAITRCAALNATRMDVSRPTEGQRSLI